MPRFSVKLLFCITVLAAAYALLIRQAFFVQAPLGMGLLCVVLMNLAVWIYHRQRKADIASMSERREQEKPPE